MEAKTLIDPIKEKLLQKYSQDELIDRLLLKSMKLDSHFQFKCDSNDFEFMFINHKENNYNNVISEVLNIPKKYILDERKGKLIVFVPKESFETFKESYLTNPDFTYNKNTN